MRQGAAGAILSAGYRYAVFIPSFWRAVFGAATFASNTSP